MIKSTTAWIVRAAIISAPAMAAAFAPSAELTEQNGLKAFDGTALRAHRVLRWTAPVSGPRADAWHRFTEAFPGWRGQWDPQTEVPARLYGPGRVVAGSIADAEVARIAAREALVAHLDLLAPGVDPDDLVLSANDYDPMHRIRTVGFTQHHRGIPVRGGQVNVRFKNDRLFVIGSDALPAGDLPATADRAQTSELNDKAMGWVGSIVGQASLRTPAGPEQILVLMAEEGAARTALVREVVIDGVAPISRWSVFLDAVTGVLVAREQTLRFASGTLQMNVPERHPGAQRLNAPAPRATASLDNLNLLTDPNGVITWPGTGTVVGTLTPAGDEVRVFNAAGSRAAFTFTLDDGGTATWDQRNNERIDAQLTTFVAGSLAWNYAQTLSPNNAFLNRFQLDATVNLNATCNAFSDGVTINFFVASRQCENTGRLVDVVYHEFGHTYHAQSIIRGVGSFDTPMSEGLADYFAATLTNDSGMGRGFFYNNAPLRELDPPNRERRWPEDIQGEDNPHGTGLILGGTLWDLRKRLVQDLATEAEGVRATDEFMVAIMQRARDIPTTYVEVLAADDDDGDITNGTPNFCAINDAFAAHGLADPEASRPPLGQPTVSGTRVTVPVTDRSTSCGNVTGIELFWQERAAPNVNGTVPFTQAPEGWVADFPEPEDNTVVQYRVGVSFDDRGPLSFPQNAADPLYEAYFGETTVLYCSDFEQDPFANGWSSALVRGQNREGANDWQWGIPLGESGDPAAARSGTQVIGNDLGQDRFNGSYQGNVGNIMTSPPISTQGYAIVRLQYWRWLRVEDGDFDDALIRANNQVVWRNFATGNQGSTHHQDSEWRFHDVDVSSAIGNDGQVQLSFAISSDGGLEFGGWTIDDLCLVGVNPPQAICGNGEVEGDEACDDSNRVAGDGCEPDCSVTPRVPGCGDGVVDAGEACDDGNAVDGDGCEADCTETPASPPPPPPPPVTNPNDDPCAADPAACELDAPEDGCGCSTTTGGDASGSTMLVLLALGGLFLLRRR